MLNAMKKEPRGDCGIGKGKILMCECDKHLIDITANIDYQIWLINTVCSSTYRPSENG